MKIKIGIAGYGKIGKLRSSILEKNEHAKVVALFDLEKPNNVPKKIKLVKSFEELLNQDIDAVFICAFNNVLFGKPVR